MIASIFVNTDEAHLTAEDVAAFLDRRMTAADRAGVEAHLTECQRCRGEIAAVQRLLIARPVRRWGVLLPTGLTAAAAAIVAIIVLTVDRSGSGSAVERGQSAAETLRSDASQRIEVLSPADGDTIRPGRLSLSWAAVTGEPTYRLTLTDASGEPVWAGTTTGTSIALPPDVILQSRRTYFWYVDALRADGRAASTGVRRFVTP